MTSEEKKRVRVKRARIREILISLYIWGHQSAYGNLQDPISKRTEKVNQTLVEIEKVLKGD